METKGDKVQKITVATVGDLRTGKTSLLWRLTRGSFPNQEIPSILNPAVLHVTVKGEKYELTFVDTNSSFASKSQRELAYANCDVIMICYDITYSFSWENTYDIWHPEVCKCVPKRPHVLVGLKADGFEEDEEVSESQLEMATDLTGAYGHYECSAKQGTNLDGLVGMLIDAAGSRSDRRDYPEPNSNTEK